MSKQKYQVLSPDNIPINCEGAIYKTTKEAKRALKQWCENYRQQGYYSQICYNGYNRKIEVDLLPDYCDIVAI